MHPTVLRRYAAKKEAARNNQPERWLADPVVFASEALRSRNPDGTYSPLRLSRQQQAIARLVATRSRVAVRSGHKVGKSTMAAVIALWWAWTHPRAAVVFTAPTGRQVDGIVWREIKKLIRDAKVAFPEPAKRPGLGVQWPDGRYLIGFSTDDATRMAGISGHELLFIVDEGSGVAEEIYDAIEGNRAGGAHLFVIGNPTSTSGTFFDAFHSKLEYWSTLHVSSEDVVDEGILGLANKAWVELKKAEWGTDSPLYQVRVAGNFATQGSNAVVPLSFVESAIKRWDSTPAEGLQLELGVDVARFGDDETVIAVRRGLKVYPLIARNGCDSQTVAGMVRETVREYRRAGEPRPRVKVDACGGYGSGVADILATETDFDVSEVNVAEASSSSDEYFNLRTQLWFGITQWLRDGGALPDDDTLAHELVAPLYEFDARGRRKVESKDDIKRRITPRRSPDRADALALCLYETPRIRIAPVRNTLGTNSRWHGMPSRGF